MAIAKIDPAYDPADVMRRNPIRALTDAEEQMVTDIKVEGAAFYDLLCRMPLGREVAVAKTKLEETVMWAVKGVTA